MVKKNLMFQALQVFNRTTSPNLLAELPEETLHIQELSEEVMSQLCGGVPPDPYFTDPDPKPKPHKPPKY
jgi:hypothetical protein